MTYMLIAIGGSCIFFLGAALLGAIEDRKHQGH
jgi:hypothetical protein